MGLLYAPAPPFGLSSWHTGKFGDVVKRERNGSVLGTFLFCDLVYVLSQDLESDVPAEVSVGHPLDRHWSGLVGHQSGAASLDVCVEFAIECLTCRGLERRRSFEE